MANKFMKIERSFTLTKAVSDAGEFEGYASVFNTEDSVGDIVMKGAFTKGLQRLKKQGRTLKMLFNHNIDMPMGVYKDAYEDSKGLYVVGKLTPGVQKADEVRLLMMDGAIDSMSIGGYVTKDLWDEKSGTRELQEIELREISPVVFPALESARIVSVKSLPDDASIGQVERFLRDAGFSRSDSKRLISVIKGAPAQRDVDRKAALIAALKNTINSLE